jgi:hypothetical protein
VRAAASSTREYARVPLKTLHGRPARLSRSLRLGLRAARAGEAADARVDIRKRPTFSDYHYLVSAPLSRVSVPYRDYPSPYWDAIVPVRRVSWPYTPPALLWEACSPAGSACLPKWGTNDSNKGSGIANKGMSDHAERVGAASIAAGVGIIITP